MKSLHLSFFYTINSKYTSSTMFTILYIWVKVKGCRYLLSKILKNTARQKIKMPILPDKMVSIGFQIFDRALNTLLDVYVGWHVGEYRRIMAFKRKGTLKNWWNIENEETKYRNTQVTQICFAKKLLKIFFKKFTGKQLCRKQTIGFLLNSFERLLLEMIIG